MSITLDTMTHSVETINGETINLIIANNKLSKKLPAADGIVQQHAELQEAFDVLNLKPDDLFIWMDLELKADLGDLFDYAVLVSAAAIYDKSTIDNKNTAKYVALIGKVNFRNISELVINKMVDARLTEEYSGHGDKVKRELYAELEKELSAI